MITELMIILIVVGAVIVFIAWTSARRRKRDEDERRDAEESTEKFKQDLEKTANEIIGRMETQAARLEKLLDDSERSRTQLEGRLAELRKLSKKTESQSVEVKDLLVRLDDASEDVDTLRRQINLFEQRISAAMSNTTPARQPVMKTLPQVKAVRTPPPIMRTPPAADNFAKVLEQSMNESAPAVKSEAVTMRQMFDDSTEEISPPKRSEQITAAQEISPSQDDLTEIAGDSAAIREMLLAGMTVEDIAKETGLGRGAILLVQQMMRHQLERR